MQSSRPAAGQPAPRAAATRIMLLPVLGLFAAALALSLLASYLAADLENYWWHVGTLGSALGLLLLVRLSPGILGKFGPSLVFIFGLSFIAYALFEAVSNYAQLPTNPLLGFPNNNIIGAALTMWVIAALVFAGGWGSVTLILLGLPAVAMTGSRAALLTVVTTLPLVFALSPLSRRVRFMGLVVFLVLAGALVSALVWLNRPVEYRNLLPYSNDFLAYTWHTWRDSSTLIAPATVPAPVPNRRAALVEGESGPEVTLVLYQTLGASQSETPYVASIFLRTDESQKLVLSSHLARTTCEVGPEWNRCVTPAAYGDGYKHVQLRLETLEPNGYFRVYAWGAQLEVGAEATAFEEKGRYPIPRHIVEKLNPASQGWFGDASRLAAARAAWVIFVSHPIAGTGLGTFENHYALTQEAGAHPNITHAHNLPLQMLAETGILGFLSWAIPFFGVLALGWRRHWRRLLPLAAAVLILNTFDFTYYSNGVYYVYWLAVGLIIFSNAPTRAPEPAEVL